MDNRQQINVALLKANKAAILDKFKPVFLQHLEQPVDDCCMRIDLEFGLQLGKSREKMSKDQYIKLLEYLRSVRREIKQNYLLKVAGLFDDSYEKANTEQDLGVDFSKISLIGDDAVKEEHAVSAIIRKCERLYYEELASLNKQFALKQGKQAIADSQNPIFPEKLVRALVDVAKPLKLNADSRIALYKAFEANVFSQLGFIYAELINRCDAVVAAPAMAVKMPKTGATPLYVVDEIKEKEGMAVAGPEQLSVGFQMLQRKLDQWRLAHFPSVYDAVSVSGNAFYGQFEIRNALQVLQLANDDLEAAEKKQPLKRKVLKKLEELSFTVDVKILAKQDEDVLDLVSLIFNEIGRDKSLQEPARTALLQLELPFAAATLGQYSVFTNQGSPVRQLLDDLVDAGMCLNAGEYDDRLVQGRLLSAVQKLVQASGFDVSGWLAEAAGFSSYYAKQKQRSHNIGQSTKQLMANKHALASGRKIVSQVIEKSMQGKTLPALISDFLGEVWVDVLLGSYSQKDGQPEQWEKSVQAMDELIMSVMPPADENERKQILKILPGLVAELRNGLKQISYDKSAQARFFKDLAVRHILLMDKKGAMTRDAFEATNAMSTGGGKTEDEMIVVDRSIQPIDIAIESWVAFTSETGTQWGKLIWKSAENMLFVGKNGEKTLDIKMEDFSEKQRLGQATIVKIGEKPITGQVLSKFMGL